MGDKIKEHPDVVDLKITKMMGDLIEYCTENKVDTIVNARFKFANYTACYDWKVNKK